jgi:hypothetical protein
MLRGRCSRIGAAVAGSSSAVASRSRRRVAEPRERVACVRARVARHEQLEQRVEEDGLGSAAMAFATSAPKRGIGIPAELAREPAGEARRQVAERAREDRTGVDREVRQRLMERGRRSLSSSTKPPATRPSSAVHRTAGDVGSPRCRRSSVSSGPIANVEPKHRGADVAVVVLEQAVDEAEHLGPRRVGEEREARSATVRDGW